MIPLLPLSCAASRPRAASRAEALAAPQVMLGVNVFAADTDAGARRLFSSLQLAFLNLRSGRPGKLPAAFDSWARRSIWPRGREPH